MATLVDNPHAGRVVVYTWAFDQRLIDSACWRRARAATSPRHSPPTSSSRPSSACIGARSWWAIRRSGARPSLDWPGRAEGLTDRESEILALITQAKSNTDIAEIAYLSLNTVKSHLKTLYRKLGVRSRTEAALWGVRHGFDLPGHRLDDWK